MPAIMSNRILIVASLVVILGVVVSINSAQIRQRIFQDGTALSAVEINVAEQPVFALLFVADSKGYFREEGVEVRFNRFQTGREALGSLVGGRGDLATTYETPYVRSILSGNDVKAVSSLHFSEDNTQIAARKDSGISKPEDLRGKRVGVAKGTNSEFALYSLLAESGMGLDAVTQVDLTPNNMVESLVGQNPAVDAVAIWHPYLAALELQHGDRVSLFNPLTYTEYSFLIGKADYLGKNEEVVTKMLKALLKAEDFLKANKEESISITAQYLPKTSEKEIRQTWDKFGNSMVINNVILLVMEREGRWMQATGEHKGNLPDFRQAFHLGLLRQLRPENVTIY